jgi:hypothetical protein
MIEIGNNHFLLYDEYLAEILNAFNLIYLHKGKKADLEKFICRLMAETYYCKGSLRASLLMVHRYCNIANYTYEEFLTADLNNKAVLFAVIQQWFIIAHEIGHWFLKKTNSVNLIKNTKDSLLNLPLDDFSKRYYSNLKKIIKKNIIITEECYCDSFAIKIICDLFGDELTAEDICESIFLIFKHMFILSMIEFETNDKSLVTSLDMMKYTQIRLIHSKQLLPLSINQKNTVNLNDNLVKINNYYNEHTLNEITDFIKNLVKLNYTYKKIYDVSMFGDKIKVILENLI